MGNTGISNCPPPCFSNLLGRGNFYYVSTIGNNANTGRSPDQAWQTLAFAEANAIIPGCIIALRRGDSFSPNVSLAITHGGTVGNPIIWDGSLWGTGANARILATADYNNATQNSTMVNIYGCKNVIFRNIDIDGDNHGSAAGNGEFHGISIGGNDNFSSPLSHQNDEQYIIINNCNITDIGKATDYCQGIQIRTWNNDMSDITIQNCTVNGTENQGIVAYPANPALVGSTEASIINLIISNCIVTNHGRDDDGLEAGIHLVNHCIDPIVEHCTVTKGVDGYGPAFANDQNADAGATRFITGGIIRYNYFASDDGATILITEGRAKSINFYYNIIYSSVAAVSSVDGGIYIPNCVQSFAGADIKFLNNTIITLGGTGLRTGMNEGNFITLTNNLIINNGANGANNDLCVYEQFANTITHDYNLYWKPNILIRVNIYGGAYYFPVGMPTIEANCVVSSNPLLVTEFSNLHLQAASPAINKGVNIPAIPQFDYDNIVVANPPEIGAYEYVAP